MSEIRQAQEAITEGFICAICREQLGGVDELLTHFEVCQKKGPSGDNNGSSGIKGFLGKAKQKLRIETQSFAASPSAQQSSSYCGERGSGGGPVFQEKGSPTPTYFNDFDTAAEVQGVFRSHFRDFTKVRAGRMERYAAEGNKLKIRLSRLVSGLEKFPSLTSKSTAGFQDSAEWKAHEKSVVNWLDEKPVTRCPECAQQFNFLRRKHHCRFCGSVLCNDCSDFIPLVEAFEILHSDRRIREDTASASITFRTCRHCSIVLRQDTRLSLTKGGRDSSDVKLLAAYEAIRDRMAEIDKLLPQLVTVVEFIKSGETLYSREEANMLRSKLLRSSEQIDVLSKQISALKSESGSMVTLQQRIRQSCVIYIRDFIKSIPSVPDMSDDSSSTSSSVGGASASGIVMTDGWSISAPDNNDNVTSRPSFAIEDNPIQQQIKNVKFYIEQAKAAGKMEEVEMLANSLRDLLLWQSELDSQI